MSWHPQKPRHWTESIVDIVLIVAILIAAIIALSAGIVLFGSKPSRAQELSTATAGYPNCAGFISFECCCRRNACFAISPSDIVALGNDTFRINRTGEIVKAKGRSPDGIARRCTGNRDANGFWSEIGNPDAATTCIYFTETGS